MPENEEHESQIKQFEAEGEDKVREHITLGRYGPRKRARAENWLRQIDESRAVAASRRSETSQAEQTDIARSAKDAAWAAAEAARKANALARDANDLAQRANKIAIAAIVVATIGAIASIAISILTQIFES